MTRSANEKDIAARSALILFLSCLVAFVSIWLINISHWKANVEYKEQISTLSRLDKMQERLRAYRAGGETFYRSVAGNVSPFRSDPARFAEEAKKLVSATSNAPEQRQKLAALVQNILKLGNGAADAFAEQLLTAYTPEGWRWVSAWIVSGNPLGRSDSLGTVWSPMLYANADDVAWSTRSDDVVLVHRLYLEGSIEAERLLSQQYANCRTIIADIPNRFGKMTFSGLGMSVPVTDLLFFLGPMVTALAIVFLVVRNHSVLFTEQRSFSYPQYASPNDPLNPVRCDGFTDMLQRAIWTSFLLFPIAILTFAVVLRYDVSRPCAYRDSLGFSNTMLSFRKQDALSNIVDHVNLGCLALILLWLSELTKDSGSVRSQSYRTPPFARVSVRMVSVVIVVISTLCAVRLAYVLLDAYFGDFEAGARIGLHWGRGFALSGPFLLTFMLLITVVAGAWRRRPFLMCSCCLFLVAFAAAVADAHHELFMESVPRTLHHLWPSVFPAA